jgi:hypothetical protein
MMVVVRSHTTGATSPRERGEVGIARYARGFRVRGRFETLRIAERPPHPTSFASLGSRPLPARGERC